ncbi:MAG: dTMP kinase [Gammaproteobacteria bacterium]
MKRPGSALPRSVFITIEGIEGVGKSTQAGLIARYLRDAGLRVVETREPGGTEVGEGIREILLRPAPTPMDAETELLLMFAARAEHLARVVAPALADGAWVVCDRFTDASYAYQGGGRGMPPARIAVLEDFVHGGLNPHLTILLDAPLDVALARTCGRGRVDRFELEGPGFFEAVRAAYLERARRDPKRIRVIDASPPVDEVAAAIRNELARLSI